MPATHLEFQPLTFPWQTLDPFLFCVHHLDRYPAGDERMAPAASLAGRPLGNDFSGKDGWSMYHGHPVPGFPQHPHRGFETVTIARQGMIDHSDSLGAAARFGRGDVQWMTAGRGVVHSEMFPLLNRNGANTTELFQIWLNLPRDGKLAQPYFSMFWHEGIPTTVVQDERGAKTTLTVVAGRYDNVVAPTPPPDSWAARPESAVAIWTIRMQPGAAWTLPTAPADCNRMLYFFAGTSCTIEGQVTGSGVAIRLPAERETPVVNGEGEAELLLLQGRPIGEPVVQHGPFVMNTRGEIQQAILDYQQTGFGGWPWPEDAPVHPRDAGRFARHADGRIERP